MDILLNIIKNLNLNKHQKMATLSESIPVNIVFIKDMRYCKCWNDLLPFIVSDILNRPELHNYCIVCGQDTDTAVKNNFNDDLHLCAIHCSSADCAKKVNDFLNDPIMYADGKFGKDQPLKVMRSSGSLDDGWSLYPGSVLDINNIDRNVSVKKWDAIQNDFLVKKVKINSLLIWNPTA